MSVRFFGQFLVERGLISSEQLLQALSDEDPIYLGKLAVAKGALLPEEVGEILKTSNKRKFSFFDRGIKLGLLSPSQVEYLRFLAKSDYRRLCANLVHNGALDRDSAHFLLHQFRDSQQDATIREQPVPEGLEGRGDMVALLSMLQNLLSKHDIVPFEMLLPQPFSGRPQCRDVTVRMSYSGDYSATSFFTADRSLAAVIGGQLFGNECLGSEELVQDALCEFWNVVAGAAASSLSALGHKLEFSPAEPISKASLLSPIYSGGIWTLQSNWGGANLISS